ncbi:MAG: peptide chain release factor N(5)-glutamine methyltransferase [Bdellovibrionales bacterium]|nr:peptide chain release factor N(5)-glutamine methyltransferase [Bdellovibrionales bacterium]
MTPHNETSAQVQQLILRATARLHECSDSSRLDAEILLATVLDVDRLWLIANNQNVLDLDQENRFWHLIDQRAQGMPVAYLINRREFFGLEFTVTPDVLIPRPETELLVELACSHLLTFGRPYKVLDLGTGSGCIAIAIAHTLGKDCSVLAVDSSTSALLLARENARKHAVYERISFLESNWFSAIENELFDCIVSNPPYISTEAALPKNVQFEPASALYAGADGLTDIRSILSNAPHYLKPDGAIFIECGHDQSKEVVEIAKEKGLFATFYRDLQGIERVLQATRFSPQNEA